MMNYLLDFVKQYNAMPLQQKGGGGILLDTQRGERPQVF